RLNVFNDASVANDVGLLSPLTVQNPNGATVVATNLSGLGIAGPLTQNIGTPTKPQFITTPGGITLQDIEVLDVLLGQGNDNFTINTTLRPDGIQGGITTIHGGGGNDTITVAPVAGSGASSVTLPSPLVIYGDTSQDASEYNDIPSLPTPF